MSKAHPPELKKFMDKKLSLKLNGGRHVVGILRGFDPFMNLVVDETMEECKDGSKNSIGMVIYNWECVAFTVQWCHQQKAGEDGCKTQKTGQHKVIRGNSIVMLEALDRV